MEQPMPNINCAFHFDESIMFLLDTSKARSFDSNIG